MPEWAPAAAAGPGGTGVAGCQAGPLLVRGLYRADRTVSHCSDEARMQRCCAYSEHADALGVVAYQWLDDRGRGPANRLLRRLRGTARPVDAVEIISIDEAALGRSLANAGGRRRWQAIAGCESGGFDPARSFILMGMPIPLLEGGRAGQKLLWFGNGLDHLSQADFVTHYTTCHGPLVAGHAQAIGLRSYLQVPAQRTGLCDSLRELGLGQAVPPAVFAMLVVGAPPFGLPMLRARRAAKREIKADERRHIDFANSMLLLAS